MIPRTLFESEHDDFRDSLRRFLVDEVMPRHEAWEEQGFVDRDIWQRAGELGYLCVGIPEAYGGVGCDRRYSAIVIEEATRAGASGLGWPVHSEIVANYVLNYGTEEQKQAWLPRMISGETIGAIAMSEPGTGSDLQAIKTVAVEDGDDYLVSGSKMFITNGWNADLVIVAARMDGSEGGAKNISLLLVEADREGFEKARPFKKVGLKAQDTCALYFDKVRVPKSNVLGGEAGLNQGFLMLMKELAWERLIIALIAAAGTEAALETTVEYTKNRKAFGRPIASFQNSRFKLAELKAQTIMLRTFVDRCLELELNKKLAVDDAAAAKLMASEIQNRVVDECLQLHGGYGYMWEYPIARHFADSRIQKIYGGTSEIMKEIIARGM